MRAGPDDRAQPGRERPGWQHPIRRRTAGGHHGASPRAAIAISEAARARALCEGRPGVGFDDVKAVAVSVLRHRIVSNYSAEAEGISPSDIIKNLMK